MLIAVAAAIVLIPGITEPFMSTGRKIGLTVLRGYLAIAMILVIIRIVQLAIGAHQARLRDGL